MKQLKNKLNTILKSLTIGTLAIVFFSTSALAQKKSKTYPLIPSLNAYSFNDLMVAVYSDEVDHVIPWQTDQ